MEIWKKIKDFETYSVSTLGNVRNDKTGRILKGCDNKRGYLAVVLSKNNKKTTCKIHRLVALTFLDNVNNKDCVDHIDGNQLNNHIDNLRFATNQENCRNSKLSSRNSSGFKGVHFHKHFNKWEASIRYNDKKIHLGYFDQKEDAIKIRQEKANELFGVFVNKIEKLKTVFIQEIEALEEEFIRLYGN